MGADLGPEEVRAASIDAMGRELGELHHALGNELTYLHLKWKEYRALFGTSPESIDLLNEAAPEFFGKLQHILWDDVLLHLCRLTDPPKSMGRANLTISRLSPLVINSIQNELESLISIAKAKTSFARDRRHRRLAHQELPDFEGEEPKPLAAASRQHVEEALTSIREVMNLIEVHYQESPVLYEHSIEDLGGVDALLNCLKVGVEGRRQRRGRSFTSPESG